MAAASEFPTELATRPLGLIALMGLDINQKPLHKAIWESFSVNRHPERVPLSFRLLPIDHEFPKAKSKVSCMSFVINYGFIKFLDYFSLLVTKTSFTIMCFKNLGYIRKNAKLMSFYSHHQLIFVTLQAEPFCYHTKRKALHELSQILIDQALRVAKIHFEPRPNCVQHFCVWNHQLVNKRFTVTGL